MSTKPRAHKQDLPEPSKTSSRRTPNKTNKLKENKVMPVAMDVLTQLLPRKTMRNKGMLSTNSGAPPQKSSRSSAADRKRQKHLRKVHKYLQSDSRDPYIHPSARTAKLWEEKRDPISTSKDEDDDDTDLDMTASTRTMDYSSSSLSSWYNEDTDNDDNEDSSASLHFRSIASTNEEEDQTNQEDIHVPMKVQGHDSLEVLVDHMEDDIVQLVVEEEASTPTPKAVTPQDQPEEPAKPFQQPRVRRLNLARRTNWKLLVRQPDTKTQMNDWKEQRRQLKEHKTAIASQRNTLRMLRSTSMILNRPLRRGFVHMEDVHKTNLMFSIIMEEEDHPQEREDVLGADGCWAEDSCSDCDESTASSTSSSSSSSSEYNSATSSSSSTTYSSSSDVSSSSCTTSSSASTDKYFL